MFPGGRLVALPMPFRRVWQRSAVTLPAEGAPKETWSAISIFSTTLGGFTHIPSDFELNTSVAFVLTVYDQVSYSAVESWEVIYDAMVSWC